jgi:hypothetical protein
MEELRFFVTVSLNLRSKGIVLFRLKSKRLKFVQDQLLEKYSQILVADSIEMIFTNIKAFCFCNFKQIMSLNGLFSINFNFFDFCKVYLINLLRRESYLIFEVPTVELIFKDGAEGYILSTYFGKLDFHNNFQDIKYYSYRWNRYYY